MANYSYDQNSNLTGITYVLNGNTVGDLSYGYDVMGQRVTMGGSLAATGLPSPVSPPAYDAANEVTTWNGTPISYDANGNMTSDNAHTYSWDERNRLIAIDSGSTGSFVYDALGRRVSKTIFGAAKSFFYDGANPVQELSGTAPTANMLTGDVDEDFTRTDTNGTVSFVTDALGSVLALADSAGVLQTQYSYDPFGNTTSSGAATSNSFAYTGRESDGSGLYYYRARYYNPTLQRFCNEDPLRFMAGINFYSYVGNSPVNGTDPAGLHGPKAHDQIIWNALHPCEGVSDADIYQIQQGSRFADKGVFQAPEYSYMHSMSDGTVDQPAWAAQGFRDDFVGHEMQDAATLLNAGDRSGAMHFRARSLERTGWNFVTPYLVPR